jgi:hypothetical protein
VRNSNTAPIVLMENKVLGYNFRYIESSAKREAFMGALKNSIPMKMWDGGSKRWWVPDLYSPIIESIAIEHGALVQGDLIRIAGYRAKYINTGEPSPSLDSDFALLGVQPGAPYRLVEMAAAYWKVHLSAISVSILELQAKEEAWARIQAHFQAEATRPVVGPLGTAR